ncbi:NAD(P)/FAD-dependent oxidoreductase [Roseibium alexandrii]|uniref:Putative NAD/FAD-dependent oxidoreductase n=1 Tax=Roseibium alexandrii (strain DSM 17067 / NCIMB 14079 / DFL-11) TaxID=244592 RepID=A0A5E8H236_ROSAD|nr:FAD-dependent oxidoreductase [Roseibium alexandrii]EEE46621.2 putative NAD/FAD-dependent oxidoreductase [Roseibium alexandrii DFL-11]
MTEPVRIGIIGAGMTGLSCARTLKDAGHAPMIFDKGRGIGGRLATRRAENGLQFDHGAQYITAKTEEFQKLIQSLMSVDAAGEWDMGERTGFIGVPSMNALAKALASDLDIRRQAQVSSVTETEDRWFLAIGEESLVFDRLIITAPAPQTMALLGTGHPISKQIAHVSLLPCWTLMAAFVDEVDALPASHRDPDTPLAWIANEKTKPGRPGRTAFVAQASPDWSKDHLELDKAAASDLMLSELCKKLDLDRSKVIHADAHRWRYAKVGTPLGEPYLSNASKTLFLGGDWCLDARVEAAFQSGSAIAEALLSEL